MGLTSRLCPTCRVPEQALQQLFGSSYLTTKAVSRLTLITEGCSPQVEASSPSSPSYSAPFPVPSQDWSMPKGTQAVEKGCQNMTAHFRQLSCGWYLTVDTCGNPDPHQNAEKTAKLSSGWHPHKAGGKACFQDLHTDESLVCILHVWHCSKTFLGYWPANLFRLISSFALIFNYYFC